MRCQAPVNYGVPCLLHGGILGFKCSGLCLVVVPACPQLVLAVELLPGGKLSGLVVSLVSFSVSTNLKEPCRCRHGRALLNSTGSGWFVTGGALPQAS